MAIAMLQFLLTLRQALLFTLKMAIAMLVETLKETEHSRQLIPESRNYA
jgi:hypothetical protein